MTSYPPSDGGDQQRRPGDEGRSQGGSPQDADEQGSGHPPPPYGTEPYPEQSGAQPYGAPEYGAQEYGGPGYGGQGYPPPAGYPAYPQAGGSAYPQAGGYPGYPQPGDQGGPVDPHDPLVATSFEGWFGKSFGVLARSWKSLLLIQLAIYVPAVVIGALLGGAAAIGLPVAVVLVLGVALFVAVVAAALIGSGAAVWCVTQEAAGLRPVASEAVRFGVSRMAALLGWGLLAGLIVLVGFLLLIIPGIYLGTVLSVVTCVVLYERAGIDRCFALVNPRFFPTLGRLLIFVVAAFAYQFVVNLVLSAIFGSTADNTFAAMLAQILTIPVSLFATGLIVVTYAELRHHEAPGSVSTPRLVAELSRP